MSRAKRKQLNERRLKSESIKKNIWKFYALKFFKLFLGFGIIIPVFVGIYVVYNFMVSSDLLKLSKINVKGNNILTVKEIEKIIYSQNKSRIYQFDINKIAQELNTLSIVKHAVVRRDLPDTISININERKSFAVFKYRRSYYEIDIDGVLIREITSRQAKTNKLPVIDGIRKIDFLAKTGKQAKLSYKKKNNAGIVLGKIPKSIKLKTALMILKEVVVSDIAMSFSIIRINAGNLRQIVLYTDKRVEIHLGNDKIKSKLNKLAVLLAERKKDVLNARYIDLRFNSINIKPGR